VDLPVLHCAPEDHAWHFFWIVLRPEARLDRNAFIEGLLARDIGFSVHYKPLHHMTYYRERYQLQAADFPNAERHWRGCVSLPLYPAMTPAEQDYVISTVGALLA
jgi:dTDP-4-amino-4,6-dideoxygalactose transaminase